jgi:Lon protease-like protein
MNFDQLVPLFPLPSAVLLPRAILPLHIFEPRYRLMTQEAVAGDGLIAIALLKPGYEPRYHALDVEIHPIVCVGAILRDERLPDGRYNLLLQGRTRARILQENTEKSYRRARLAPLPPDALSPEVQQLLRAELQVEIGSPPVLQLAEQANWVELLKCQELCLSDTLDLLASVVLQTAEEKQAFLSQPQLEPRVKLLRLALRSLADQYLEATHRTSRHPRPWPPQCPAN